MSDKQLHMDPEILIGRYLSGEATQAEVVWLEKWVLDDPKNKEMFLESRKVFNLTGVQNKTSFDAKKAWDKVAGQVNIGDYQRVDSKVVSFSGRRRLFFQLAAAIAVLVVASIWWYINSSQEGIVKFGAESMVMVNELPDGSVISLNRNTKVRFEQKENRQLTLRGDAFFEVKRDEKNPFIVQAGELKVRVLGTSFYVNAQEDRPNVEVMVKTGMVAVQYGQDSLVLTAGESATFNKETKSLIQSNIEDINYLSWKTRTLVFEDETLSEVVQKINSVYNTNIVLKSNDLDNCKITVTFKQQELDAMLIIIAETLDLSIERNESQIILDGRACN